MNYLAERYNVILGEVQGVNCVWPFPRKSIGADMIPFEVEDLGGSRYILIPEDSNGIPGGVYGFV